MWARIYALLIKEFLNLFKDKKSRTVLVVPPLIQMFVFGYAATYDLNEIPMAIYNEDSGDAARDLVARFQGAPAFNEVLRIEHHRQLREALDNKAVLLIVHIGEHFSRDLKSAGRPAKVQVLLDGRDSNTAQIALGYVQIIVNEFNLSWAKQRQLPAALEIRAWFNPNLESRWFIIPGIVGLLTLVVTLTVMSLSIAREREQGTFDQLLVTPFTPLEILIGKAIPGLLIALFEATFIITMAVVWFEIPLLGSIAALYLGIVLFSLAAIGVGLMISSLALTQQQGLMGGFLFIVPAVILSGYATPIANMPSWVQTLTLINPLRYFLVITRGVFLEGATVSTLQDQYWPMAVIGLICLITAAWLFRRRMN